jgi:hypothetical protein
MTKPTLDMIRKATGVEYIGCPWRSFFDRFVRRIIELMPAWESGNLALACPDASSRTLAGLGFYGGAAKRAHAYFHDVAMKDMEMKRGGRR